MNCPARGCGALAAASASRKGLRDSVGIERVLAAPNMKEQTRNTEDTPRAPRGVHKEESCAFSAHLCVLGCGPVFGPSQATTRAAMRDSAVDIQVYLALKKLCRMRMARSSDTRRIGGISPSMMVSPLECVVTKNAPVSALECVLTKTKDLNFPGINSYKKTPGGAPASLARLSSAGGSAAASAQQ